MYDYDLPAELIAKQPALPRDAARLLVYDPTNDHVSLSTFAHLPEFIPTGSLLVFNNTKVVPARLTARRETGGRVSLLLLVNEYQSGQEVIRAIGNRQLKDQEILTVGEYKFRVRGRESGAFLLILDFPPSALWTVLESHGETPLPPYLTKSPLNESARREKYQSILASSPASAAAPTASLHFTPETLSHLSQRGIEMAMVTLHVGRGTFEPLRDQSLERGHLHAEPYIISPEALVKIDRATNNDDPIIAVGTTVARTLESVASIIMARPDMVEAVSGETSLFIRPPYTFQLTDGLVTNFHLPNTSLLYLVDAFLQARKSPRTWRDLYQIAIGERFRFYSFGDGMLILSRDQQNPHYPQGFGN